MTEPIEIEIIDSKIARTTPGPPQPGAGYRLYPPNPRDPTVHLFHGDVDLGPLLSARPFRGRAARGGQPAREGGVWVTYAPRAASDPSVLAMAEGATRQLKLARYVRAERERRDLSPRAFAAMAGITWQTLARVEAGRVRPAGSTLCGLAQALGHGRGVLALLAAAEAFASSAAGHDDDAGGASPRSGTGRERDARRP